MADDLERVGAVAAASLDRDGFAVVRGALSASVVEGFVTQIVAELALAEGTTADSERTVRALALDDPRTWPTGGQRRVVECAPKGDGAHWGALTTQPRLVAALDAILGRDAWEIPTNTPAERVRYFYAPVVFPEDTVASAVVKTSRRTGACEARASGEGTHPSAVDSDRDGAADLSAGVRTEDDGASTGHVARLAELMSWKEERRTFGEGPACRVPQSRWQPVNRRRFRGKGWHIDIGPGFDGTWMRTLEGHPYQGVVMLLVLSDWEVGGGGTCMVRGSHRWVRDHLAAAGEGGMSHDDLNRWCVDHVVQLARDRTLRLDDTTACDDGGVGSKGRGVDVGGGVNGSVDCDDHGEPPTAVQIVARAGDVVLMHPLVIHGGTTNHSTHPRLMANGMARVKQSVFDAKGHPLFPRTAVSE